MEFRCAHAAAERRPDRDLGVEAPARAVAVPPELGSNLVKRLLREAEKLDFGHQYQSRDREPKRGTHDCALRQRGVEHAVRPKAIEQTRGRSKDAAQGSDVKAQEQDPLISLHLEREGASNGLHHVHLGQLSCGSASLLMASRSLTTRLGGVAYTLSNTSSSPGDGKSEASRTAASISAEIAAIHRPAIDSSNTPRKAR